MPETRFKFERLEVWKLAMSFAEELWQETRTFPESERYALTSQLTRAVDSIALNIAEGSISQSDKELAKFLGYAIRSLAEVITCLYKARNRKFIRDDAFTKYYDLSFEMMNRLNAFRKKNQELEIKEELALVIGHRSPSNNLNFFLDSRIC
mgnify:CR=1 FL=1